MITKKETYKNIVKYLNDLGYGTELIEYEIQTPVGRIVDILVSTGKQVLIGVEIISDINLLSLEDIGYNPIVRQLQRNCNDLEAKLFLISDGYNHLWFRNGDNGRPKIVDKVPASEIYFTKLSDVEFLHALIEHVSGFLENFPITGDLTYDMSIAIYTKICFDLHLPFDFVHDYLVTKDNYSDYQDPSVIQQIIERWSDLNFYENRVEVLKYIDSNILIEKGDWQIPKWLADFMVSFYPENHEKGICLDLFSKNGVILSSAYNDGWTNVDSFYFNKKNEFWIKIQELLIGDKIRTQFNPNLLSYEIFNNLPQIYDAVFVAPPFGLRLDNNQIKDSTELLIIKALAYSRQGGIIIALIPDSVLFSTKFNNLRKEISRFNIRGIINLSSNSLRPYTAVSTSILVIEKGISKEETFLATLDAAYFKDSDINKQIIEQNWSKFLYNEPLEPSPAGFVIGDLNSDNFHFSKYWFNNINTGIKDISKSHLIMPLKEISDGYYRGNNYKQNDKGDVAYIAPAAVRSLKLIEDGLSFTTKSEVPAKVIRVVKDDILVNIIGTQRGSAAIVTSEFDGLGINHHVIVVKPNLRYVRPIYLMLALNSEYVQKQFQTGARGSVIPSLNLGMFDLLTIPIPPFYIQDKICANYINLQERIAKKTEELNLENIKLRTLLFDFGKKEADESIS